MIFVAFVGFLGTEVASTACTVTIPQVHRTLCWPLTYWPWPQRALWAARWRAPTAVRGIRSSKRCCWSAGCGCSPGPGRGETYSWSAARSRLLPTDWADWRQNWTCWSGEVARLSGRGHGEDLPRETPRTLALVRSEHTSINVAVIRYNICNYITSWRPNGHDPNPNDSSFPEFI